jgi:cholesterol oxidase
MSDGYDYDVIVVGSGFGGAVAAYRMAQKGKKVCLIERGKRYGMHEFPRRIHEVKEGLFWDPRDKKYGIMEFRDYKESDLMSVSASGLGGGSLIYANVLMPMPSEFFEGWPCGVTREVLDPHYREVLSMMEASPYPFESDPYYADTPKTRYMQDIARDLSQAEDATAQPEFIFPDLAINFKGDFAGQQVVNRHGAVQSKCTKCGECDIGCNIHAKNTLDLNYIFAAEKQFGLEVKTGMEVSVVCPGEDGGYVVSGHRVDSSYERFSLCAEKVILAAGCLGTNKLLLQMKRDNYLPNISPLLGKKWCGNGDLEGSVLNSDKELLVSKGPTITGAIRYRFDDYPDGFKHGAFIQDAGAPTGLIWYLAAKLPDVRSTWGQIKFAWYMVWSTVLRFLGIKKRYQVNLGDMVAEMIDSDTFARRIFLLLGMGRDRNDGEVHLNEDGEPIIKWKMDASQLHYDRVRREMRTISERLNGTFMDNPLTHLDKIIAVHPIGGCAMADSIAEGVVDARGEVFNYPGLHVMDASVMPTSLGPNPSLTIAAVAEYMVGQIE